MKSNLITTFKPERVFLVLSSIFGVIFLLLTPPFQSPDENRHFYRAYHVSQGSFSAEQIDGRVGGFLPKKVQKSLNPFSELRGKPEKKTSREEIFSTILEEVDNTKEFVDFPSVAVYTPLSYIPQATGIRVATLFSDSPILALYFGRLAVLICWILAIYHAIRITPILKWLFVVLALLPMSLYISASVSSDTITNGVVFLLIAILLKQAFSDQQHTKKDFLILGLLVFLVASAKFIYSPIVLLYFLIPSRNFESKRQFFFRFALLGLIALCTTVCWPLIQGLGYVPYADYNPEYSEQVNLLECSNLHDQMDYIASHGAYLFEAIGNSIVESFDKYYIGFIGNFGWGEAPLSSFWLIFAYIGLLLIALADGRSEIKITVYKRLLVFSTFALVFCLVIISQLLIWTCVGDSIVENLQGRYFVPIGLLLFFLFYRSSDRFARFLPVGVILFSSLLLTVSTSVIYNRFYSPLVYATEVVFCDHEKGKGTSDFGTSNPQVFAGNGFSRSDEDARSGKYSAKLSSEIKYGTMITFQDCKGGDELEVEAWSKGPNGKMVVSAGGGEKFYQAVGIADSLVTNEWQSVKFSVRIPPVFKSEEFTCYLAHFGETDSCYFDDIKITLNRLK